MSNKIPLSQTVDMGGLYCLVSFWCYFPIPLNLSPSLKSHWANESLQIGFNPDTSLIAIFSHSVSWDYSPPPDYRFRSSSLHRWVPSSTSAPSVVLSCSEWWRPALCRLSHLICASSLHAPLSVPATNWWLCLCVHSPCAVPLSVDFFWWLSYAHTSGSVYIFLKANFVAAARWFG